MQQVFNSAIILALALVVVILAMGIWNMFKGGNPNLSQKLMRARVIAQFAAIALIFAAAFLWPRG